MAKYDVKFSCGHSEKIELYGNLKDRYRKIEYFEQFGICSECYKNQQNTINSNGCKEITMRYREYKESYEGYKTKIGSYDTATKTIVVYVPYEELCGREE